MTTIFSSRFARQVAERAVKTAAQSAVLVLGAESLDAFSIDARQVVGMALGGALLSILTSIASLPVGPKDDASVV